MKKILACIMIGMIIVLGISIERDISTINNENSYNKYINYNMTVYPENLKLTARINPREKDLLVNLFQGLVKEDKNGNIVGALAEDYYVSEDGLEYNFNLRKDIYYSSGEKITSQDFAEFFKNFLEDEENLYRSDLDCIYGAKDFREGGNDFSQVAIIPKEDSLTIRLNYPCSYFLDILSHPVYVLRDYHMVDNYKNDYKQIRYTGPFIIKSVSNEEIILSKNSRYYKEENVTQEEVRISFIDSSENALAILEDVENKSQGKVDLMMDVPINEVYRLRKGDMIKVFEGNEVFILNFNEEENKVSSTKEFKTAIKDVLDREAYADNISNSLIIPVYSAISEENEELEVFKPQWKSDVKKYFNELDKDDDLKIRVVYEDKSLQRRIAKELCEKLLKDTKVEFIPIGYSAEELQKALDSGEYDIYLNIFKSKYDYELEYFQGARNLGDQSYVDILNEAQYMLNKEERKIELKKCEQILSENLGQIPLYKVNSVVCYKENLSGFYVDKNGNIDLEEIKRVR